MKFFTGLLLLIIGSIIVIFLVSPNTFKSIGDSINNVVKPTIANVTQQNYVAIIPSQMQEYNNPQGLPNIPTINPYIQNMLTCSSLEANGQASGISDAKSILCQEACGKRSMNFGYYSCDKDLLTCYCSP